MFPTEGEVDVLCDVFAAWFAIPKAVGAVAVLVIVGAGELLVGMVLAKARTDDELAPHTMTATKNSAGKRCFVLRKIAVTLRFWTLLIKSRTAIPPPLRPN